MPPEGKRDNLGTDAIADRLRLIREAKGLIQASMARLVGITPQEWNNWERGRDRISLEKAIQVCAATGASLDWIYRGDMKGLPLDLATRIQELTRRPHQKRRA
jgi:transcriptional regulator with XRE-family HTH domain